MHTVLLILGLIACPLMMFAMGGVAWAAGKLGWGQSATAQRNSGDARPAACDRREREAESTRERGPGGGGGSLMPARRFPRARVRGVDISVAMVAAARAKAPPELADRIDFVAADAATLPFEDRAFDLVAQLNVPVYLDEVARVLRPGG